MAKKRCWFCWMKRLVISEAKTKEEKKSKRWRWVFGRLKIRQYPALAAPTKTLSEATEEQRNHALTVALATAAAAEAAVAAAHAAAEIVRLTGASQSYHQYLKKDRNFAAIKIQSAFRAHLARKALRALKALVRLQAIVRGRAVRRQAITTLKCLPSNAKIQSKVREMSIPTTDGIFKDRERKQCLKPKEELEDKEIQTKLECNNQRRWDFSLLLEEDMKAMWLRKQEATAKRERMRKYSYSHRERRSSHMLEESVNKENGRRSCRLELWADTEANNREGLETVKPTVHSNLVTNETCGPAQVKLKNNKKQDLLEGMNMPLSFARRSFCRTQQNAAEDDSSIPNSPVFPTYMAVTQSAKSKSRSISTPKQRLGFLDTCFDHRFAEKNGLPLWSSYNGDSISSTGKSGNSQKLPVSLNCHF